MAQKKDFKKSAGMAALQFFSEPEATPKEPDPVQPEEASAAILEADPEQPAEQLEPVKKKPRRKRNTRQTHTAEIIPTIAQRKSERLQVLTKPALLEWLKSGAEKEECSVNEYINRIMEKAYFEERGIK